MLKFLFAQTVTRRFQLEVAARIPNTFTRTSSLSPIARFTTARSTFKSANMVRIEAGAASDYKDGQMKAIPLDDSGESTVLVSKVGGKLYATSSKCTHYGAPLVKGVLSESGCVTCPWHGSKYNVCTGDIEDAPGIGSLNTFKVIEENGKVYVEADSLDSLKAFSRAPRKPSISAGKAGDLPAVVVVGGGAGGQHFLEHIREAGWEGPVTLVTMDENLPIDRTKLSKALITNASKVALRDQDYYVSQNVTVHLSTTATALSPESATVTLSNGSKLSYSHLVLATGSEAKTLPVEGKDLNGVYTMRKLKDVKALDQMLGTEDKKSNLVIIGSSFIGMEVAMSAAKRANISIVGMESAPFEKILGTQVGNGIRESHEKKGVKFYMDAGVDKFLPSDTDPKSVGYVLLKSGTRIPCSAVLMGVGARPATSLLESASIPLEEDGSVLVDPALRVVNLPVGAAAPIYAIGDIARFPDALADGALTRIEHWNVASNHGRAVADHIASGGLRGMYTKPAIFWSALGGQLRYVSTAKASKWEKVWVEGNPAELNFIAWYSNGNEIVAVASMGRDPLVMRCAELMGQRKMVGIKEIKEGMDIMQVPI